MSEQTVVDLEPLQRRATSRAAPAPQPQKAEVRDIMAWETVTLATAVGDLLVRALERRERQKERRFLTIMLIGIAALIGLARYMMQLVQN